MQLGLPFGHNTEDSEVEFYFVRHPRARRYLLRVDGDGRVRVTIPRGGSRREAAAFGLRHLDWIAGRQARIQLPMPSAGDRRDQTARAGIDLPVRLLELAAAHGLAVSRVSVRSQRTRWGSCGRDGHISLKLAACAHAGLGPGLRHDSRTDAPATARPLYPVLAPGGGCVSRLRKSAPMASRARAVASVAVGSRVQAPNPPVPGLGLLYRGAEPSAVPRDRGCRPWLGAPCRLAGAL